MRLLGSLSVCVLVLASIYGICEAGPIFEVVPPSPWTTASGHIAAGSIGGVLYLFNTFSSAKYLQAGQTGPNRRYTFYRIRFNAYSLLEDRIVRCQAQVHWPPIVQPEPWTVHVDTPTSFLPGCV